MDQNLAISCIEVVENLSQKEKNKILSVLKRDDKLRIGQEQKISQLKQEIKAIRKNGVLRAGDDQTKMCIRCRALFGIFFNRGDICPACRFRVCRLCQEVMFNKAWLCKLCYKQRQLKWLTGEWAASFEQNPLRKWASGTDISHGSLQVFSGATSLDIGESEASNRTNNNRSSKSAHNGVLSSPEQDKQRVEYPKEGDQLKLSQLFGVLRSRKPEETTKELQVRRVSTRKYSESDSDSSSSSDVEAPSVTESELDKTESPRSAESPKSRLEAVNEDINESVESDRVGKHKIAYKSKQKATEGIMPENVSVPLQGSERIVRPKVAQSGGNRPKSHRTEVESDSSHSHTHPRKRERKKIMPDQTVARELRIQAEEANKVSQSKSVDINLSDPSENELVSKRKVVSHTELNSKKLGDPYARRSHESLDKNAESHAERVNVRKSNENLLADSKPGKTVSPVSRHSTENLSPRVRNKANNDIRRSHESLDTAKDKNSMNQNIRQARSHEYLSTKDKINDEKKVLKHSSGEQLVSDFDKKGLQKPAVDIEVTHANIHVSDIDNEMHSEVTEECDSETRGQRAGSPYSFSMDSLPSSNPSPTLRRSIDSSIVESSDTDSLSKASHHEEFSGTESQVKDGSEDDFTVEEISKVRFQRVSRKAAQMSAVGKISNSPKRPGSCEGLDRGQRKSQSRGGSGGGDENGSIAPEIELNYMKVFESPHLIADKAPIVQEIICPSKRESTKAASLKLEINTDETNKNAKETDKVLIKDISKSHVKQLYIQSVLPENINRSRSAVSSTGSEPRSAVDLSWFDEYAVDLNQYVPRQVESTSEAQVFVDAHGTMEKPDSDTDSVEGMIDNMARSQLQVENVHRVKKASEADSEGSFNMTPVSPFAPETFDTRIGTYTLTYMESDDNLDAVSTDDCLDNDSDPGISLETSNPQSVEEKIASKKEKLKLKSTDSLDIIVAEQKHLLELDQDIVEIDTEFQEALKLADTADNQHITKSDMINSSQAENDTAYHIIYKSAEVKLYKEVAKSKNNLVEANFVNSANDKLDGLNEINEIETHMGYIPGKNNFDKEKCLAAQPDFSPTKLTSQKTSNIECDRIHPLEINLQGTPRAKTTEYATSDNKDATSIEHNKADSSQMIEPEVQMRTVPARKLKSKLAAMNSLDFLVLNQGSIIDPAVSIIDVDSELRNAMEQNVQEENQTTLELEESVALSDKVMKYQEKQQVLESSSALRKSNTAEGDTVGCLNTTDKNDTINKKYDQVDSSFSVIEPEIQVRTIPGRKEKANLIAQKSIDVLLLNQGALIDPAVETVELDSELRTALEEHLQANRSTALELEDMLALSDKDIDYLGMQLNLKDGSANEESSVQKTNHKTLDSAALDGTAADHTGVIANRQVILMKDNASESEESDVLSVIEEEEEEFSESSEQFDNTKVVLVTVPIIKTQTNNTEVCKPVTENSCMSVDQNSLKDAESNMTLTDKVKIIEGRARQVGASSSSSGHQKYEGYDVKIHSKFKKLQERWNAIEKHEADLLDFDENSGVAQHKSETRSGQDIDTNEPSSILEEATPVFKDHVYPSVGRSTDRGIRVESEKINLTETAYVSSKTDSISEYENEEKQIDRVEKHAEVEEYKNIVLKTAKILNICVKNDDPLIDKSSSEKLSDATEDDSISETELMAVQMRLKPGRTNILSIEKGKANENVHGLKEHSNLAQIENNQNIGAGCKTETCQGRYMKNEENDVRPAEGNTDFDSEICQRLTEEHFENNLNLSGLSISDRSGICQSLTDINAETDADFLEKDTEYKIKFDGTENDNKSQDMDTHENLARCQSLGEEGEWHHLKIKLQHENEQLHESVAQCQSIAEGDSQSFYIVPEESDHCISIDEKLVIDKSDNSFIDDSSVISSENIVVQTDEPDTDRHESDGETVHRPLVRLSKLRKGMKSPPVIIKPEVGDLDRAETFVVKKQVSDTSTHSVQGKTFSITEDSASDQKDSEHGGKEIKGTENPIQGAYRVEHESVISPEPQCFKVPNIPLKLESRVSYSSTPSSPDLSIDLPFTPADSPRSDKISRMSPQTISESSVSQDDSGLASGGSRGTTPEHKRTDSGYSQSSLPSTLSTVTDRSTEEEDDIDKVVAKMKPPGGRGNLLNVMADSRESIASFYSDAGDIAHSNIPVTGEILFGLNYNYKTGMLEVHVKQCRDIAAVDTKRNRSDPYVKTYLLPDKTRSGKRKTKVKKHTVNPTFDELLKYSISKSELENRTLWLTVWHNDRFGRNDFLGEVTINFDYFKFDDDPSPKWYPLQERLDAQPTSILTYKGDIVLSLRYVPADKVKTTEFKGKPKRESGSGKGQLHVVVKEARNLTAVRSNGFSDPFCKGYLLPERHRTSKQKTAVIKKNCSPVWNHTFIFEDVSIIELQERCLELTIWDYEKLASNDFLGGTRLNLGTGMSQGKPVDWMDARGEEMSMWQAMLDRPNIWIDGTLILRPNMEKRKF